MINVLIIEDDPMVAKFNAIYLESIPGFSIAGVAESAEEGWELYQSVGADLILLDVYMGRKTGLELLRHIRRQGNAVDVIIISAANDKESIQTALRYGATDYLIKPFNFERFQAALLRYAKRHRMLKNHETIGQDDIDAFFMNDQQQTNLLELPKGLTKGTLTTIVKAVITCSSPPFSVADLAAETGISRVSVRKYLNYLVEATLLEVNIVYQEAGRPLNQFIVKPGKVDILKLLTE